MNCKDCGASLALVGRMHRCMPRSDVANSGRMANSVTSDVANRAATTYRYRDAEKRRALRE
jgi:hypothetical protein